MKMDFVTVVWGSHCDLLIKYALPSLLARGNSLPEVDKTFTFFTNQDDFGRMERDEVFDQLKQEKFNIKLVDLGQDMHLAYRNALRMAHENKSILKIVVPDVMISARSIKYALDKIEKGHVAVVIPTGALRVNQEDLPTPDFFDAQELSEILRNHMHQETRSHCIESEFFFHKPVYKITRYGDDLFVNSFFYQTFMLDCRKRLFSYNNMEVDIVGEYDDVYVARNSSEIFEISLSPQAKQEPPRESFSESRLRGYAESVGIGDFNRKIYRQGYRIYA